VESATSTTVIELFEHIIVISTLVTVFTARVGEHNFNVIIIKIAKYSGLEDKCIFQPIAVQSLGPLNETACQFLKDLGRRISAQSGDEGDCLPVPKVIILLSFSDSTLYCSTTV